MVTGTEPERAGGGAHLVRMLQLASPSLPVGGFSYSQGLEQAVELGWVDDPQSFEAWLSDLIHENLSHLEIPVLVRLIDAANDRRAVEFGYWTNFLYASRETRELREEEIGRGRAMRQVLAALCIEIEPDFERAIGRSQLAGLAWAASHWRLPADQLAVAYAFSWLENQVTAGIKLIPLGQSAGQRLMATLGATLPGRVSAGLAVSDPNVGASSPALAIASSLHETQYSRLFRS
ncbi:MAG: urease accessory protein UreF [Proteobacteria bacterium]|nr:MAG: urease accessory protein UreF [Pseudomonadota bacterium]